VFDRNKGDFTFVPGPIFAHVVLADEINRAPAKTQSALLEAMQDHTVTEGGTSRELPLPFLVVATQNPVESQGTYPLPEAQLDRFLFKLTISDPPMDVEQAIVRRQADGFDPSDISSVEAVCSPEKLISMQNQARAVKVDDKVIAYAVEIVRRTRQDRAIEIGASPRASLSLVRAAQVIAASEDRDFVTPDDVKPMAAAVLRHRLLLQPDAQLQGTTPDDRIAEILKTVAVPR
jgi:MoxR-like ATPase